MLKLRRQERQDVSGALPQKKYQARDEVQLTQLPQEALHDDLVESSLLRVDPVALRSSFWRDVLERRQPSSLLDVEAQISSRAVVHDEVDSFVHFLLKVKMTGVDKCPKTRVFSVPHSETLARD